MELNLNVVKTEIMRFNTSERSGSSRLSHYRDDLDEVKVYRGLESIVSTSGEMELEVCHRFIEKTGSVRYILL